MKITLLFLLFYIVNANAADKTDFTKVQTRLFVQQTKVNPKEFNEVIQPMNLQPFLKNYGYGVEITQEFFPSINLGLSGGGRYVKVNTESSSATKASTYFSSVQTGIIDAILRIDIVKNPYLKFDIMGGFGLASNKVDISTKTGGEGSFTKSTFHKKAGASLGFGAAGLYLMSEAGYEWNDMDGFSKEGRFPDSANRVNMSGPYLSVGLILTGDLLKTFGGAAGGGGGGRKK